MTVSSEKFPNISSPLSINAKFSGTPKVYTSNFLGGELGLEALGSGVDPKKVGGLPNLSSQKVLEQWGCAIHFKNLYAEAKNCWDQKFELGLPA